MYECSFCSYTTKRKYDLHRHMNRKRDCTSPKPIHIGDGARVDPSNSQESHSTSQESHSASQESHSASQESHSASQKTASIYYCNDCKTQLSSKDAYFRHKKICRGVERTACTICLKRFKTNHSRRQHMRNVQCSPPPPSVPPPSESVAPTSVCNQTANVINNNHIVVNNNVVFGKEMLEQLCSEPNYTKRMEELVRLGKYAIPQQINDIFFNEEHPMNQTIMKKRHNDRFVKVKTSDNSWDIRAIDDVYNGLMKRMEGYMSPYFKDVEQRMETVYDEDPQKFRQLTRDIRAFGHRVLWLDWSCEGIRQIGVELNEPYCENEKDRCIKEMKSMMLEHIYDKTCDMLLMK